MVKGTVQLGELKFSVDASLLFELGSCEMLMELGSPESLRTKSQPWDNWAFGPVVLDNFLQVPAAVTSAGFLSPRPGDDFAYEPGPTCFPGVIHATP